MRKIVEHQDVATILAQHFTIDHQAHFVSIHETQRRFRLDAWQAIFNVACNNVVWSLMHGLNRVYGRGPLSGPIRAMPTGQGVFFDDLYLTDETVDVEFDLKHFCMTKLDEWIGKEA